MSDLFRYNGRRFVPVELPEKDKYSTTDDERVWLGEVNKALNDALTRASLREAKYTQLLKRLRDQAERQGWHNLVNEIDATIKDAAELKPDPRDMKGEDDGSSQAG